MSLAGVIVYQINHDGSLDGRWTHPEVNGATGTERATGGTPGRVDGKYNVEVFDGAHNAILRGSLEIAPIGGAYSLTWVGRHLPAGDHLSTFKGIGLMAKDGVLAAAFQESA